MRALEIRKPGNDRYGFFNRLCPEEGPGRSGNAADEEDLERVMQTGQGGQTRARCQDVSRRLGEPREDHAQAVDRSPSDEGPVGPMPSAAQEKDDQNVPNPRSPGDALSTEGHVDVVTEPSREGDVPSPPKL